MELGLCLQASQLDELPYMELKRLWFILFLLLSFLLLLTIFLLGIAIHFWWCESKIQRTTMKPETCSAQYICGPAIFCRVNCSISVPMVVVIIFHLTVWLSLCVSWPHLQYMAWLLESWANLPACVTMIPLVASLLFFCNSSNASGLQPSRRQPEYWVLMCMIHCIWLYTDGQWWSCCVLELTSSMAGHCAQRW